MISTSEIEIGIEQRIEELSNLPCLNFTFSRNDQLSPPSLSINQTTIVSHRALNLGVISNHNWVFIESRTPEQEEAGDAERADSKGSSMYPEK
jgi:hypothetical protein